MNLEDKTVLDRAKELLDIYSGTTTEKILEEMIRSAEVSGFSADSIMTLKETCNSIEEANDEF